MWPSFQIISDYPLPTKMTAITEDYNHKYHKILSMQCNKHIIYNAFFYLFQDSELTELRTTIEALKRQSGLNIPDPTIISPNVGRRHTSPGMVAKVDIHSSPNHQTHQHHQHQHHQHHHTQGGRAFHTLPMPAGNITWTVLTNQCCHCTVV